MLRRLTGPGGPRRLLPVLLLAGSLAAPAALTAQAAGEDAGQGPASSPAAVPGPGTTTTPSVPAEPAAPAPSPQPAPSGSTTATVSRADSSATSAVAIVDYAFNPGAITIQAGDTVQWTDNGTDPKGHTVTGEGFDSGILQTGAVYSFTFPTAGDFSYACSVHPTMKGSVHVLAASTGSSSAKGGDSKKQAATGGGSGSSGGDPSAAPAATTEAGSESAATSSPAAAGSSSSLPSTGFSALPLLTVGLLLVDLGLALRLAASLGLIRRR
jgi:plastocyanin